MANYIHPDPYPLRTFNIIYVVFTRSLVQRKLKIRITGCCAKRVPYTFFREWAFLLWLRIYFFCDSWIYIFSSSGNWHLLSRDFWTNDFCGNNFSLFWRFLVLKARKLHQTRCKTCPFDELANGGLRTNQSDSNLEGVESAIMYKSLWTNLHFGVFAHTSDANTTSAA